jgi:hypothetical protein
MELLQAIRGEIALIRTQQSAFDAKLAELNRQCQRLDERLDGVPDFHGADDHGTDAMDLYFDDPHRAARKNTTSTNG